ncbi:hypothetical protein BU24DRAFT_450754 [Aaosphaeria arxii CBS 175.79]|uniref:Gamma-glutamylcyclotransferase AIG2-like domain-containing protein n=1 Tax=Aaosphaeria arxii CBS 175.79 TaxID=1450172 RepID=A0A6A5XTX7_9PLEO|nr:uncharacterized protein BU24DRAFT_450754 [Aaosphaeria arxii CBS 175.79]KAF2016171.1 hypothetical protein BU24DRAFT_450754 [Aaosphaeria arxii CBS 175.79]
MPHSNQPPSSVPKEGLYKLFPPQNPQEEERGKARANRTVDRPDPGAIEPRKGKWKGGKGQLPIQSIVEKCVPSASKGPEESGHTQPPPSRGSSALREFDFDFSESQPSADDAPPPAQYFFFYGELDDNERVRLLFHRLKCAVELQSATLHGYETVTTQPPKFTITLASGKTEGIKGGLYKIRNETELELLEIKSAPYSRIAEVEVEMDSNMLDWGKKKKKQCALTFVANSISKAGLKRTPSGRLKIEH